MLTMLYFMPCTDGSDELMTTSVAVVVEGKRRTQAFVEEKAWDLHEVGLLRPDGLPPFFDLP